MEASIWHFGYFCIYIILGKLVNRPSSAKQISATFNAIDLILVSLESPKKLLCYILFKKYLILNDQSVFWGQFCLIWIYFTKKTEIYFLKKSQMWTARLTFIIYTFLWCKNVWNLILITKCWKNLVFFNGTQVINH